MGVSSSVIARHKASTPTSAWLQLYSGLSLALSVCACSRGKKAFYERKALYIEMTGYATEAQINRRM